MKWQKIGRVLLPDDGRQWARSHLSMPTPARIGDNLIRVFCSSRDANNVGRIGYVDIEVTDGLRTIGVSPRPVLDIGAAGSFDDNGVAPSSVVFLPDGTIRMYYVGFELSTRVRYRMLTGIAESGDGGETFERVSPVPALERSRGEPLFRCGPYVRRLSDGQYRMLYAAGGDWITLGGKQLPKYEIRQLTSADGRTWPVEGTTVLRPQEPSEHGLGRPYLMEVDGQELLLLSVRDSHTASYRLGCAVKSDDESWVRQDDLLRFLGSSTTGRPEPVMYAAAIRTSNAHLLFFDGENFGAEGFDVARLCEGV